IGKEAWDSIAPADQAVVRELTQRMQTRLEDVIPLQDRQALDEMSRRGLTITHPRDEQQQRAWEAQAERFASFVRDRAVPADAFAAARKLGDGRRGEGH